MAAALTKFLFDNPEVNVYYGVDGGAIAPVMKNIQVGARGGLSYENSKGKRVYLKQTQRRKCERGFLSGAGETCEGVVRSQRRKSLATPRRAYGGYVARPVMSVPTRPSDGAPAVPGR